MYKLTVTSESKESVTFSPQNSENYSVISITGLNPVSSSINTSALGLSGEIFNSSKIGTRNVVITIALFNKVEEIRNKLYGIFQSGEKVTIDYQNSKISCFINGYVESIDCDLFTNQEKMQISIICPYPYFSSSMGQSASGIGEVEIYNPGIEIGCTIKLSGANPTIKNETAGQEMILTSSGSITINSQNGKKSITQGGIEIFPYTSQNDWITLKHGSNRITSNVGSMTITFTPEYNGV